MNLAAACYQAYSWIAGIANHRAGGRHRHQASMNSSGSLIRLTRPMKTRIAGQKITFHVRPGTTDIDLAKMILNDRGMYQLPKAVEPRVIFDIGANIGLAALYFAAVYPNARIYCFEPLPSNLELLRLNTSPYRDRIHVVPYGLSDRSGKFQYHLSDNPRSFGGGSFQQIGHDPNRQLILPLASVPQALAGLDVDRVDVFKIDTEGCEWAILNSMPQHVRLNAQAIIGELHGVEDWRVCQLLAPTHAIGVQKSYDRRCFPFLAVRKDVAYVGQDNAPLKMAA